MGLGFIFMSIFNEKNIYSLVIHYVMTYIFRNSEEINHQITFFMWLMQFYNSSN